MQRSCRCAATRRKRHWAGSTVLPYACAVEVRCRRCTGERRMMQVTMRGESPCPAGERRPRPTPHQVGEPDPKARPERRTRFSFRLIFPYLALPARGSEKACWYRRRACPGLARAVGWFVQPENLRPRGVTSLCHARKREVMPLCA